MAQVLLTDAQSLINDALFRAGEVPGSSEWDTKALEYINREYRALCAGASEFLPEYIHDWWWMRKRAVLTILPAYTGNTIDVTQDSASAVLDVAPTFSIQNYRIKIGNHFDIFKVQDHIAGNTAVTLDSPWTGDTGLAMPLTAMKVEYSLDSAVDAIMSPFTRYDSSDKIIGLAPERMDEIWPLTNLRPGIPQAFSLLDEQTVRFSHGGTDDGRSRRLEYIYRPSVDDLMYSTTSIPLLPIRFRHVLSDMTLVYLFMDKNDDRLTAIGTSVRSALGAMVQENRRRISKIDNTVGKIQPRQARIGRNFGPLRTESGLIIG